MHAVNVTELRNHLPRYLSEVQRGDEILITLHGHVIARIVPPTDTKHEARQQLLKLRKKCTVGDVVSPLDEKWEAEK